MKTAISVACVAFSLLAAPAAWADNSGPKTSPSLNMEARGKVATELMNKPVQTTPVASLTWYHMIETPAYVMGALQPWSVTYELATQKPVARFEPEGHVHFSVNKVDTKARTYLVDCIVKSGKGGTQVKWQTRNGTNPAVNASEGTQTPKVINGVEHVSFIVNKPLGANFANVIFSPTLIDFYVYQCDIAQVL